MGIQADETDKLTGGQKKRKAHTPESLSITIVKKSGNAQILETLSNSLRKLIIVLEIEFRNLSSCANY